MKRMCLGVLVFLVIILFYATADATEVLVRPFGLTQMGDEVFVVQKPIIALVGGEKQVIEQGERLVLDRKGNIAIAKDNKLVGVFSLDGSSVELIKAQEAPTYAVNNPGYSQPREVVPKQSSSYPYGPYGPQKSNATGWISTIFGWGLGGYGQSAERRGDYQTAGQLRVAGRILVPAIEGRNPLTEGNWQDYEKGRVGGDVADAFGWTKDQNHHDNNDHTNNRQVPMSSGVYPW